MPGPGAPNVVGPRGTKGAATSSNHVSARVGGMRRSDGIPDGPNARCRAHLLDAPVGRVSSAGPLLAAFHSEHRPAQALRGSALAHGGRESDVTQALRECSTNVVEKSRGGPGTPGCSRAPPAFDKVTGKLALKITLIVLVVHRCASPAGDASAGRSKIPSGASVGVGGCASSRIPRPCSAAAGVRPGAARTSSCAFDARPAAYVRTCAEQVSSHSSSKRMSLVRPIASSPGWRDGFSPQRLVSFTDGLGVYVTGCGDYPFKASHSSTSAGGACIADAR